MSRPTAAARPPAGSTPVVFDLAHPEIEADETTLVHWVGRHHAAAALALREYLRRVIKHRTGEPTARALHGISEIADMLRDMARGHTRRAVDNPDYPRAWLTEPLSRREIDAAVVNDLLRDPAPAGGLPLNRRRSGR